MSTQLKINALIKLGNLFSDYLNSTDNDGTLFLKNTIERISSSNTWFTKENIHFAIENWRDNLKSEKITEWIGKYNFSEKPAKKIGVIMAGNIPLVGFHDLLCVILSGNIFIGKLSSKDDKLMKSVVSILQNFEPSLKETIIFEEQLLKNFDAVIATGSNNTSRYFEYYFGKYPHIIRKNRNSVAVLRQIPDYTEFKKLADDIFVYFGLGCRNVSKLFVPRDFKFTSFIEQLENYSYIRNHNKYANNYDYNKAILLLNQIPFIDTGYLVIKEDFPIASPTSVLHYEFYDRIENVEKFLVSEKENIQCIVSDTQFSEHFQTIPFGMSQNPELHEYSDNVDTMSFLENL